MKMLLPIFLLTFFSQAFAKDSSRKVLYWCDPSERVEGLEAVIISDINNQTYIEVYTESKERWGTVDIKTEMANLSIASNHQYLSRNNQVKLTLFTGGTTSAEFVDANFIDLDFGYNVSMYCEHLL